jgi:glycosyltransferase involved in cell wall biosynthesis
MTTVHLIVPQGLDEPTRPSGGNTYDRRVSRGLGAAGWDVHEDAVPGSWPHADASARAALAGVLRELPDGAVVLVDGLVASDAPEILVPQGQRLRLVVLLHMPLGERTPSDAPARGRECAVLSAATAVVTTSAWSRDWVLEHYPLDPTEVHVAPPGVDGADLAPGTPGGGELLCVAAVLPDKGHDVLLAALAEVADLPWRCACVGSLTRDPGFVDRLVAQSRASGLAERISFTGPRTGDRLEASYAAADVLVLATRVESYGMVVPEALARGLPVLATAVGGLPEALGRLPDGTRPGLLVAPDDAEALAGALRRWLCESTLRDDLRRAARERRMSLSSWDVTSSRVAGVLSGVAG